MSCPSLEPGQIWSWKDPPPRTDTYYMHIISSVHPYVCKGYLVIKYEDGPWELCDEVQTFSQAALFTHPRPTLVTDPKIISLIKMMVV